jgi:hypothetical protein
MLNLEAPLFLVHLPCIRIFFELCLDKLFFPGSVTVNGPGPGKLRTMAGAM